MALQMLLRLLLKPAPDVRKKAKITLSDYQLVTAFFVFSKIVSFVMLTFSIN
jgi:hypothetical protein